METNSDDDGLSELALSQFPEPRHKESRGKKTSHGRLNRRDPTYSGDCDLQAEQAFANSRNAQDFATSTPNSRAQDEEAKIAESAAKGSTSTKFAPGEKGKTPRDTDHQDKMDNFFLGVKSEEEGIVGVMSKLAAAIPAPASAAPAATPQSPSVHKHKKIKALTELISQLVNEKKEFADAGLSTGDVEDQIKVLQGERRALNQARASRTNLGEAFNAQA